MAVCTTCNRTGSGDIWFGGGSSSIFGTLSSDDTSVPGQAMKDLVRFVPN